MKGPDALSRAPMTLTINDKRIPQNPLAPEGSIDDIFISELDYTDLSDPLIERIKHAATTDVVW